MTANIYTIDATDKALGRIATEIATALRGKHLASYMPHLTPDIEVLVTNLNKVKFTGKKLDQKVYHRYSGYHGGIHTRSLTELWDKKPEQVLRQMVYRMLPVNKTRDKIIKNLKFRS